MNTKWIRSTSRAGALVAATVFSALLLGGCTTLEAVRAFAKTSADTAEYKKVADEFASGPTRLKQYAPANRHAGLDADAKARVRLRERFDAAQAILVAYMNALGDLAADELPSLDKQVDGLGAALEKAKFVGTGDAAISKSTATAAASIAKVLGRVLLDHWRQARLAELIRETDEHVQVVVSGLRAIVMRDFDLALRLEAVAVGKYFDEPIAAAEHRNPPDTDMIPPLARILKADRLDVVTARRAKLKAYAEVLGKIGTGHADLLQHVGKLDDAALTARLKQYAKDLIALHKAIFN